MPNDRPQPKPVKPYYGGPSVVVIAALSWLILFAVIGFAIWLAAHSK